MYFGARNWTLMASSSESNVFATMIRSIGEKHGYASTSWPKREFRQASREIAVSSSRSESGPLVGSSERPDATKDSPIRGRQLSNKWCRKDQRLRAPIDIKVVEKSADDFDTALSFQKKEKMQRQFDQRGVHPMANLRL